MTVDVDPTTQANYTSIASEHVHFDWTIDWAKQVISGSVTHTLTVREDGVDELVLDALALDVHKAFVETRGQGQSDNFTLGPSHPVMGAALHVPLPSGLKVGNTVKSTIHYSTTKDCMALQWLDKEQTQGKTFPYLFSQCQPIYARSLAPLQDTPSVKIVHLLRERSSTIPVLLSAIRASPPSDGPAHDGKVIGKDVVTYTYNQAMCYRVPRSRQSGAGVAEPEFVDAAYWEFGDAINNFMLKAETVLPPYRFGVYDVLVLPPSFPYGGMENACLTFLTPTLLVGDRSLVDVVVHELSHSWFGNGVTQAHSTHFWLNEGWTTWMERLILQLLHGPAERGFNYLIGYKSLKDDLELYKDRPKARTRMTRTAKSHWMGLQNRLWAGWMFLPYSITTAEWKSHYKIKALDSIDWDGWLYGEGTELPVKMQYDVTLAEQSASAPTRSVCRFPSMTGLLANARPICIVVFLERLHSYPALPATHVTLLGSLYKFSTTTNAEIRLRFYESSAAKTLAPEAAKWVTGEDGTGVVKGRMKDVSKVDRDLARLIEKDLGLA
ncbi:uncharacterized protein B0H18DRAFT_1025042 [Fomitopsis serialis]|uniref:uncharacterized protein n=1 Tax=Fomitopsis serialis TaxID=139415 RepID=UPI002007C561|nr:uncharacterized protein B0H18DRAFT_1025042 [Neoantrodia serialis]KAH9920341.1 hypothetical protein B0H18DRAFT_1025042 [Neoantrodia serialis]